MVPAPKQETDTMLSMPRGVPATRSYFERHSHEYHPARLRRAVRWIEELAPAQVFARRRVEFRAHRGSILDPDFVASLPGGYDVVVMAAVLHHLVGRTRRSSRRLADTALRHALGLLAPGGRLVIVEPTYAPRWAMTALFWVKQILGVAGRRIELGKWNNLGAPLVSYYDPAGIRGLVGDAGGSVVRSHDRPQRLRRLPRVLGIRGRWTTTVLVRPPHI
jgi:SAM-dependent methyltransferase